MEHSKVGRKKRRVNPTVRRFEIGIAGCLVENELNGNTPNLARLLDNAPESFDDARPGKIAAAVKELRSEGKPVHDGSVLERLTDLPDAITFLEVCHREALPLSVAEFEAETVLGFYQNRRTAQLLNMATGQLITATSPEQHATVRRSLISELERLDMDGTGLSERLEARLHRPGVEILRPASTYSINGVPIATAGNIETISGPAKSGKTSLKSGLVASTYAAPDADTLSCGSSNPNGYAVIDIDSEQSLYDHQQQNKLTSRRAGRPVPLWVKSYCLTGFSADEIRQAIPFLLERNKREFGGIHSLILDGGADALHDVNDPGESNELIAEHHALAIKYACPIFIIIHENPGENNRKMRGHYGSQAERKAETNLRVEKDEDGICTVWAEKTRHKPIPKKSGPRFQWDSDSQMHRSIESQADAKADAEFNDLSAVFKSAFTTRPAMSNADLKTTVMDALSVVGRTADRKIARAVTLGIIKKTFGGLYELRT
jgi:hypothetical protein